MAARLPAAVCEDTLISEGAPAKVVPLADLLATLCVGFPVSGPKSSVRGIGCWGSKPGHDAGSVSKGLALFGYGPDIDVILDGVTRKGGVGSGCLSEQTIVFQAMLRWVVGKEHNQKCLVLGHLQGCAGKVGEMAAEKVVPGFEPGREVSWHTLCLLPPLMLLLGDGLEQGGVCRQEEFVKLHVLTSAYLLAEP